MLYRTCPLLQNCGVRAKFKFCTATSNRRVFEGGVCSETSASMTLINLGLSGPTNLWF